MSLSEAERLATQWLVNNGVVPQSEIWVAQYKELVRIIWQDSFKKAV